MWRFYSISIESTLFGTPAVIREWGRLGSPGRRRLDLYDAWHEAVRARDGLIKAKLRRGYVPCLDREARLTGPLGT